MKLIIQLAVAAQKNRNVVRAGKLSALVLVAAMVGCASYPVPKNTLGPQARALANEIHKNPQADISKSSTDDDGLNGIFREKKGYYISDTRLPEKNPMGRDLVKNYTAAFAELCRRKGGEFYAPFCRKNDSVEAIIFYAKVSVDQLKDSLYPKEDFGRYSPAGEILIYEKTADTSPEFVNWMRYYGFKSQEEIKAAEAKRLKMAEEWKLSQYKRSYETADAAANYGGYKFVSAYEKYVDFIKNYVDYDPDGVLPRIREYVTKNKKAYEDKKAEEERKQVEARRELVRREMEAEAEKRKAVRTVGRQVCKSGAGTESVYSGYVIAGTPYYEKEDRTYQTKGIVEQVSGDRILVRIGSISATNPRTGSTKFVKEVSGAEHEEVNQVMWSTAYRWNPC